MNEKVSPAIVYCYMLEISSFPSLWKKPVLHLYISNACLDPLTTPKEGNPNSVSAEYVTEESSKSLADEL